MKNTGHKKSATIAIISNTKVGVHWHFLTLPDEEDDVVVLVVVVFFAASLPAIKNFRGGSTRFI